MKTLLVVLLAFSSLTISAEQINLTDRRPDWSIGFAAFEGKNLSPENNYLTRSFPLLIRERLEGIPEHYFSQAEMRACRRQIIQNERQRLVKAVADDRRTRDELFFTSEAAKEGAAMYEQRIADNLAAIRELGQMDPDQIAFAESKPLRFVSGADGQLVFDRVLLSPFQLAKQQDLDVLLWGGFEEVQGFLYFEITVFSTVLGEPVFTYSDAAAPIELYEQFDELVVQLATILWGRDWSSLSVQTVPPGASVWIDEEFQGRSPLIIPYLLPGKKQLRVHSEGYQTLSRTIELAAYEQLMQQIALTPQPRQTFTLNSDPPGATVYRGSEWLGTTPLSIEEPEELGRFLLRREGYLDFPLYLEPSVDQSQSAELLPQQLDPTEMQTRRRNELYGAFGAFALSVPLPMFFGSYRREYRDMGMDISWLTYAYFGTYAISGGLFVNLLVRLIRYLRAADRKA